MRGVTSALAALMLSCVTIVDAANWGFQDGSVSVRAKGAGVDGGEKQKLTPNAPISSSLSLDPSGTLRVILTTVDGTTAKRPHQAFLNILDPATGLQDSFPLNVKENGKARLDLTQKDLPFQFLASPQPLQAKLTIASFGSSKPYESTVFTVQTTKDSSAPLAVPSPPTRYGRLPEIHHIFRDDPRSPPKAISGIFTLAVLGALPVLIGAWLALGANFNHLGKAMGADPISHAMFIGSVAGIEGVFFLYYTSWNLFQTLPAVGILGAIAIVSGSRALSEVQERRLAGER